ncbi:hypothetical protein HaLaN_21807 [Haematococcus lacustris]|uniref:Uncharacterized protein n=1 Tax=Haematococcus lacustris TaxID=44745 RepID=A0A699ZN28_HAELA|nr:hypothetical protein HaLaN_21807 [Haematococcus lacustris]
MECTCLTVSRGWPYPHGPRDKINFCTDEAADWPVKAMGNKKRGVKASCVNAQKAREMLVHLELVGKVCGAIVLTGWANEHFAVPCHAQNTRASHRQRGHMLWRYLVLDDARQATVCCMPKADVERMHDDVEGCRAVHRMVFTPDREQP